MGNGSKTTNTWIFMEGGRGLTPEETDELAKKGEREYRLELEVGYPKELHKNDNELPF